MDSRAAFAFAIIGLGLTGLFALATGNLAIVNGQVVIGKANVAAASSSSASGSTAPVAGANGAMINTTSNGWGVATPGAPTLSGGNPAVIGQIVGGTSSNTTLGQVYDPSQTLALISAIAGDGTAVLPYGTGVTA
jgi:hypothetical protein